MARCINCGIVLDETDSENYFCSIECKIQFSLSSWAINEDGNHIRKPIWKRTVNEKV